MNIITKENLDLSIVVPLLNEENNIKHLLKELEDTLLTLDVSYEILLVDDGSSDATWETINHAAESKQQIRGIKLVRNFGHQQALLAD